MQEGEDCGGDRTRTRTYRGLVWWRMVVDGEVETEERGGGARGMGLGVG